MLDMHVMLHAAEDVRMQARPSACFSNSTCMSLLSQVLSLWRLLGGLCNDEESEACVYNDMAVIWPHTIAYKCFAFFIVAHLCSSLLQVTPNVNLR